MTLPSIGRIVHFVGESRRCLAAIVTQDNTAEGLPMTAFHPSGVVTPCVAQFDEDDKLPGTWHWPERV